jgi:hypothetical protein
MIIFIKDIVQSEHQENWNPPTENQRDIVTCRPCSGFCGPAVRLLCTQGCYSELEFLKSLWGLGTEEE